MKQPFYITTPIYYVNAEPHLGHAYTTIVADVLNRFHLLCGDESYFLTGTDEHGDKIVKAAEAAGSSPREYVDRISNLFRELWPKLNISNNDFIRTTDPHHQTIVRTILDRVNEKGDIYFSEYAGLYCFGCERFYMERELVDGKCPDHQVEPELIREANYFFRMSRYQDWLIEHIKKNPAFIRPERYKNEVLAFLREPLEDLCISRPKTRLEWGITLPFDENYVTYVWFDALINYISALDYPNGRLFKKFWPSVQHIIAKDILKPHGIYWPCMLKSAGIEPYQHLNVHGYWNIEAGKMSKSLGNVVRPQQMVETYGLDAFRFFLMRDMVFGLDSDFSEEALINRINADLANDLGNLVSRSLSMVHRYFKGQLPEAGPLERIDLALKEETLGVMEPYRNFMKELAFHRALMVVWGVIGSVNKYIDTMAPWELAKSDPGRLNTVMRCIVEPLKVISVLLWPFVPETAEKIQGLLKLTKSGRNLGLDDIRHWGEPSSEGPLAKSIHLFPRIDTEKKSGSKEETAERRKSEKEKALVSFDDFQKLDLRIGLIKAAEAVPKADRLLKLTVDIGEERTIVAGIAKQYEAEQLIGRQVVLVANLEPVKLKGVESQGMILAAEDSQGIHLLTPDVETKPGSKVK